MGSHAAKPKPPRTAESSGTPCLNPASYTVRNVHLTNHEHRRPTPESLQVRSSPCKETWARGRTLPKKGPHKTLR